MTFISDLAPYNYLPGAPEALAVGWLDASEPFATGTCPDEVKDRLRVLARTPVRLTRGYHYCQFCLAKAPAPRLLREDIRLYEPPDVARSHGEIWLTALDGTRYAAPEMLAHYVDAHGYLPPSAFIEAVRFGVPTDGLS